MLLRKLPRLAVNWFNQPEMIRRYWDQAMASIENGSYVLVDAMDDTAAASAGVSIGQLYRTGNTVKIRLI